MRAARRRMPSRPTRVDGDPEIDQRLLHQRLDFSIVQSIVPRRHQADQVSPDVFVNVGHDASTLFEDGNPGRVAQSRREHSAA